MNDDTLKSLLRTSAPDIALRSAEAFWADAERQARAHDRARALPRRLAPAWVAGIAGAAAAAAILVGVSRGPNTQTPALNKFQIGSELPNNGALIITDKNTDATILWIITTEET
ncbi:MAG: hypothetical protein ACOX9C_01395 [Kiritimatiellia bacterium]|jgi:hypothetical protein